MIQRRGARYPDFQYDEAYDGFSITLTATGTHAACLKFLDEYRTQHPHTRTTKLRPCGGGYEMQLDRLPDHEAAEIAEPEVCAI